MTRRCRTPPITLQLILGRVRTATCVHSATKSVTSERTCSAFDAMSTTLAPLGRLHLALHY